MLLRQLVDATLQCLAFVVPHLVRELQLQSDQLAADVVPLQQHVAVGPPGGNILQIRTQRLFQRRCSHDAILKAPTDKDVQGWAQKILGDVDFYTGAPLADAWMEQNGPVPVGTRLSPAVPFAFGGEYEVD
jgi:hypothetical protein